jgi:sigma-E factor negative regulatory protein RseC
MQKESEGVVISINGNMAKVKANRHGDCKNCGACPGDQAMVVDALNTVKAKPGQRVAFEIKQANMLRAAFVVYMLPLIAIFIGAMVGNWVAAKIGQSATLFQVCGAVIGVILSVLYIKFFDKSASNDTMQPTITRILS